MLRIAIIITIAVIPSSSVRNKRRRGLRIFFESGSDQQLASQPVPLGTLKAEETSLKVKLGLNGLLPHPEVPELWSHSLQWTPFPKANIMHRTPDLDGKSCGEQRVKGPPTSIHNADPDYLLIPHQALRARKKLSLRTNQGDECQM